MVRKQQLPEEYRLAHEKTRRAMNAKLDRVSPIQIEFGSAPGYRSELRIGFRTYKDRGYVDMRLWFLKDDEWLPTRRGVSMSPYYVLAGVVEALKKVRTGKEFWVRKGRRPGARGPDLIKIALRLVGHEQFVYEVVDVQTLVREAGGYEATEKGLVIPLDLLPRVIRTLERFAQAVGKVNPKYLRLWRLTRMPDR